MFDQGCDDFHGDDDDKNDHHNHKEDKFLFLSDKIFNPLNPNKLYKVSYQSTVSIDAYPAIFSFASSVK